MGGKRNAGPNSQIHTERISDTCRKQECAGERRARWPSAKDDPKSKAQTAVQTNEAVSAEADQQSDVECYVSR